MAVSTAIPLPQLVQNYLQYIVARKINLKMSVEKEKKGLERWHGS